MIYLVSTPQRCGSTWLVKMLAGMAESRDLYVDGLEMGFSLARPRKEGAVEKLAQRLRRSAEVRVFKTHDVPRADFDALCGAMPELRILTMHRDFRDIVVSRYFYLRYYWESDPGLGPLPSQFARFLSEIEDAPDHEAMEALLGTRMVHDWAREWSAFEGRFTTPNAVRVSYVGMLDESEFPKLAKFTGLPLRKRKAFEDEQRQETHESGRDGKARFNRRGLVGEWREWWTEDQGAWLESLVTE